MTNGSSIRRPAAELERLEASAVVRARDLDLTAVEMEIRAREFCMVFGFEFIWVSSDGQLEMAAEGGLWGKTRFLDPGVWLIILERARAMCSVGT